MQNLHIDLETRSRVDIKKVGIDNYANHPSTKILMLAYAFDDDPVEIWEPHKGPLPEHVASALTNEKVLKYSWNVNFEFNVISCKLGLLLKINQWRDPAAHARYIGYPPNLEEAGSVLKIDLAHMKSKTGKDLIKLLCIATKEKKATKKKPAVPSTFNDWNTHPAEWELFCEYCKQDVVAEREIAKKLTERCVWPESEINVWIIDQVINARGIPTDLDFCAKALALIENERAAILFTIKCLTGVENPNSKDQLKVWLADKNYAYEKLDKECVAAALKSELLHKDARTVLENLQLLGGIAFKKLPVIQAWTREDRLRYAFLYHSAHTGRWSSKGVQFHNLLRPTKRVAENLDAIISAIKNGTEWPKDIPIVEGIAGTLRAAVCAREEARLFVADFSSIENRVLAWLAQCPGMLDVFEKGLDPYKSFAARMYKRAYDSITKEERNFCKSPVLGCGFGMGAMRLIGYAAAMGQTISEEQAKELVYAWREAYPEVPEYWDDLGNACVRAVAKRLHLQLGPLKLDGRDPAVFKITLPSGRQLCYDSPEIGRDRFMKSVITHMTEKAEGWYRTEARGSSLVENVVQAIARDLLVNGMYNVQALGFEIVLHVHDELVCEVPYSSPLTYAQFEHAMIQPPSWALDLPIKAEGYEGPRYKK